MCLPTMEAASRCLLIHRPWLPPSLLRSSGRKEELLPRLVLRYIFSQAYLFPESAKPSQIAHVSMSMAAAMKYCKLSGLRQHSFKSVLRPQVGNQLHWAKGSVSVRLASSRSWRGRSFPRSLSFDGCVLCCTTLLPSLQPLAQSLSLLLSLLTYVCPFDKEPRDCVGPSWRIQMNLLISRSFASSNLPSSS